MMYRFTLCSVLFCVLFAVESGAQNLWTLDSARTRKDTMQMKPVDVVAGHESPFIITRADDVEAGVIYAAKKVERIRMENVIANVATNNVRQVLVGVAGLNIWESDGVGLQLGIGGRGLNPNRTSNFTTRQNGYDISADPLGYPESYYVPPMMALERIDVVRGAGALRYGTQFGGVVNFVFREGAKHAPFSAEAALSGGSYGFTSAYAQVGGTADNVNYTALYQFRSSDGWRPNSDMHQHTAYAAATVNVSDFVRIRADYTFMTYLAHQPGGLTDRMFADDPQQSVRARNWFTVNWNLASVTLDWIADASTSLRSVFFGNISSRDALGNLNRINTADLGGPRTMISGSFHSIGNETTVLRDYVVADVPISVLGGIRLYRGTTQQQQGSAEDGSGPNFTFTNPNNLEGSNYQFPNDNAAVFGEAVISINPDFKIVPGLRVEHIITRSNGYYTVRVTDLAGNVVLSYPVYEQQERARTVLLGGIGLSYKLSHAELYANATQNYRSITFSDLRVNNPNLVIDPNISDERGYTLDLGVRGEIQEAVSWDMSVFYLRYNRKIGEVLRSDQPPLYLPYRYRTNIADAYTAGIEAVADIDVTEIVGLSSILPQVHAVFNGSILSSQYLSSGEPSVTGKQVEYAPPYVVRTGLNVREGGFRGAILFSFVGRQYSDATNAEYAASAVVGVIPAYWVADVTAGYSFGRFSVDASCNNIFNRMYFTRRADSYPGPGIIPADAVTFTIGLRAAL